MANEEGKGEPGKPKPALVRLGQNGAIGKGAETKIGTGSPFGSRLHSFKGQRDLSLGAKAKPAIDKKKFVPNLNVQRQVKKEEEDKSTKKEHGKKKHERRRKHEKQDKNDVKYIQTMGSVFADGVVSEGIRRRGASSRASSTEGVQLQRPKLEMNVKFDPEDEKERLKALLRDDFIDDLLEGNYVPVQLPMVDTGKIFKAEVKKEKEEADEDNIKPNSKKVRTELDSDDDDDPSPPQPPVPEPKAVIETKPIVPKEIDVADLIKAQKGDLLFIQLPDNLPGAVVKSEPADAGDKKDNRCSLSRLAEGQVGKLQIRRSGLCQLVMGDNILDVEVGTRVGFLQDAVSVKLPDRRTDGGGATAGGGVADLTVLGHVKHRLVITPNWKDLLGKAGLDSDAV